MPGIPPITQVHIPLLSLDPADFLTDKANKHRKSSTQLALVYQESMWNRKRLELESTSVSSFSLCEKPQLKRKEEGADRRFFVCGCVWVRGVRGVRPRTPYPEFELAVLANQSPRSLLRPALSGRTALTIGFVFFVQCRRDAYPILTCAACTPLPRHKPLCSVVGGGPRRCADVRFYTHGPL